jgi:hypothetical protein
MDPELKALIDEARERGASMAEIRSIMEEYYGLKKKDQEITSPSPLDAELGSLGSESSTALGGEQAAIPSDLLQRPLIGDVRVSPEIAEILNTYADNYDNAYLQTIYEKFDVSKFVDIVDYNNTRGSYQEFLNAFNQSTTEDEKFTAKKELVDFLIEEGDPDFEINRNVLGGITDEVYKDLTGNPELEGEEVVYPVPLKTQVSKAVQDIGAGVSTRSGAALRQLLPEDVLADPKRVSDAERFMYDNFGLSLDFNEDRYIGGAEVVEGGAFAGFGRSVSKAWKETMAGLNFIAGDAVATAFGDDNWFSKWAIRAGEEGDRQAQEIAKELPISLERLSAKTEKVLSLQGEEGELDDLINDYLRMGGESVPMMGGALAAGFLTRGAASRSTGLSQLKSSLKGLSRAEQIAKTRQFMKAGTSISQAKKMVRVASQSGAFVATSTMGMGTQYNAVRDEEWFQEMSGAEKAAYTSIMGVAEGLPALVAANISARALGRLSRLGKESFVRGLMKATGMGMIEEGATEAITAGVQYITNVAFNPNVEFDFDAMMLDVKDGLYGGIALGGGVSVTSQIPGAIYAGAMAVTSLPAVRDSIKIDKLTREYDSAPDQATRQEIGKKLEEAVMGRATRNRNRRKFYEDLFENNKEAWSQLTGIQKQIIRLGLQYERTEKGETRDGFKAEMVALLEERTKLEKELGMEYDLDINKEFKRVSGRISKIDRYYNDYGSLFEGDSESTTVTGENADTVLDAINEVTFNRIDQVEKLSTGVSMKRALKNVVTVAKALAKTGKFEGVVIHKTDTSFMNATGEALGRGMWLGKGRIHIYAPAAMENTSFHEAFHDLVLEAIGEDAVQQLSVSLYKGLSGELRKKYNNFLAGQRGVTRRQVQEMEGDPMTAEEFLVELLGDITTGDVSIEVQKGLVNQFKDFVAKAVNTIPGVEVDMTEADPRVADLVTAIQKMTGQLAAGEAVTATEDLRKAAVRAGYSAMTVELADMDAKAQGIFARNRDVEEVTDAGRWAAAMAEATDRMKELKQKMFLQVTAMTEAQAQEILDDGGKLFMTKDGLGGAYLKADGYMGGLFKNPDSQLKAISGPLQTIRAREGGKFYDAFATRLEEIYVKNGWKPVARLDFDEQFAPEGWNDPDSPLRDKPDVVFFVKGEGKVGDGIRMSRGLEDDYDRAYDYTKSVADGKPQALVRALEEKVGRESYLQTQGVTEEELEKRKEELRLEENQRQKRTPKVVDALKRYVAQEITQEQYIEIVRTESPITPFKVVPEIPPTLDMGAVLTSNKTETGIIGLNKEVPDNYYVGLRLDIPAYDFFDTWVVSVHQGSKTGERSPHMGGKPIGYAQTALATNVEFHSVPLGALNIALEKNKQTIARMFGDWNNHNPEELRQRAIDIMAGDQYNISDHPVGKHEGWVQVGMNPFRHSWFYDKRDGNPIVSASEVIQIGALVLAKDVEKVPVTDERFSIVTKDGVPIKFQHILPGQDGMDTKVSFSNKAQKFGRISNRYAVEDGEFEESADVVLHNAVFDEVLNESRVIVSSPDHMLVGTVYLDDEVLAEGGGGLYYPVRTKNTWAFGQKGDANAFKNTVNQMRADSPDGKVHILLVSGTDDKVKSNITTMEATMNLMDSLVGEKILTQNQVDKLIVDSLNDIIDALPAKDEGKFGDKVKFKGKRADIRAAVEASLRRTDNTSFELRRKYMDKLFANLGRMSVIKENPKSLATIKEMTGVDRMTKGQVGSTLKRTTILAMIEGYLQGVPQDVVYAAIEVDSDLEVDMMPGNEAFPAAVVMRDANGNKKTPKIHLFADKPHVNDVMLDNETGLSRADFMEAKLADGEYAMKEVRKGVFERRSEANERKAIDGRWKGSMGLLQAAYGRGKTRPKAQAIADTEAKAQGSFLKKVSQMIDKAYPSPIITRDKRRKNPVTGLDESQQMDAFAYAKDEVIKTLMDMGMSKEGAEMMFKKAVAYKQGRLQGKKEGMRVAMANAAETRKMGTKAKNLQKALTQLKDKSKTFNEFLTEAIKLIDERMKENAKTPFTRSQITAMVKAIRQAHKTSGKRVEAEGLEAMQTFIDKISAIFDKRDSKAEMQRYLDGIKHAQKLQKRLKRMARPKGRSGAAKNVTTYAKIANGLARINPALLPQNELEGFVNTLMSTISSMSKTKAVFDPEIEAYVGAAFPKAEAQLLYNKLSNYQAMEELGRQAVFMARAQLRAAKNNTTVEEEYDKLVKNYERSRLSSSRRAILKFIDENPTIQHPDTGETVVLNASNPAHVDLITQILADQAVTKEELQKDAIINDVLLPRIVANIEKLLEDTQIADILGIYSVEDLDFDKLRERLNKLKRHHIINLDYRLDDYIVNDSVYGIGYMHALVQGNIDMPSKLDRLVKRKGLKARKGAFFGMLDTVNSYLSNVIPTDRITFAKLRVAIGLAQLTNDFAKADFIHSQVVELLESEIDRITEEGGSVTTRMDRAIMQLYSMAKQMPEFEGERGQAEAAWYLELRNAMRRTIDYYAEQQSFSNQEIDEFEDAFSYLFNQAETLPEMIARIESERKDVVEMVQFTADIHTSLMPAFRNYVERYLGKELVVEDNYTAFEVIPETGAKDVDDMLQMRISLNDALASSSLSQTKKVAGSSFERNPRSLKGKNRIGLDFLSVNERTLRDNIILSNTVGSVVRANYVLNSDAMKAFIPNAKVRMELERKIMLYVQQDTGKIPPVFQPTFKAVGFRFINPINLLRNAVIVKAFGSFGIQTLKQSTVLTSVMFQTKNPIQSIPYLLTTLTEMVYFSLKTLAQKDSKLALDDGRYKLLQNSPVFQRDYEAGNIDPYTGRMSLDEGNLQKAIRTLSDISLKNLKGTDKVAAVASWFTFYGDALISEGVVDSFDQIDWDAEAVNPNQTALSYADAMVNKDQAASTPREAADLYMQEKGVKSIIAYLAQNILLPFSRFAVNKKRSISSDFMRIWKGDLDAKKEGSVAMLGHAAELTLFAYIGKVLIPAISSIFIDDDEEDMPKDSQWRDILSQVIVDAQPLPPMGVLDNQIKGMLNEHLLYPYDVMMEGDFDLGDEDGYERWTRLGKGAPMYYKSAPKDPTQGFTRLLGPYGDFIDDARTIAENLALPPNRVVSSNGTEYFVRPEDKEAMQLHYYLKTFLFAGQMFGLSSKEIDVLVRDLDNLPRDRRLSNEEALAAYEIVASKYGEKFEGIAGEERLREIIDDKDSVFDKQRAVQSTRTSLKPILAEKHMKETYPDQYKSFMRETRKLTKQLKNARDYYAYLRGKRQDMEAQEFAEFKLFLDTYFGMVRPSFYVEKQYIESVEE